MSDFFWKYPVTCNAGCHAKRGVGPATDYAVPWGTPIHAPFAGVASAFTTVEGGNGIRLVGKDYTFVGQHLAELPRNGSYGWRDIVAKSGNTGTATTGPHIHAYIIINATGKRVSFEYWYDEIIHGGSASPVAAQPTQTTGKKFTPPAGHAYWYVSFADAQALRNVKGNGNGKDKKYTNDKMVIGTYDVIQDPGTSFAVRAHDGTTIWISGRLRSGIH